jgi:hypothetical protein
MSWLRDRRAATAPAIPFAFLAIAARPGDHSARMPGRAARANERMLPLLFSTAVGTLGPLEVMFVLMLAATLFAHELLENARTLAGWIDRLTFPR